jgi:hypothetical protein
MLSDNISVDFLLDEAYLKQAKIDSENGLVPGQRESQRTPFRKWQQTAVRQRVPESPIWRLFQYSPYSRSNQQ